MEKELLLVSLWHNVFMSQAKPAAILSLKQQEVAYVMTNIFQV
jgi:hypothetical protein